MWSLWSRQPDQILTFNSIDQYGSVFSGIAGQHGKAVLDAIKGRAVVIQHMAKLVELHKAGQPVYGKIHNGARAGSIVRLSPSCITLRSASYAASKYAGRSKIQVVEGHPELTMVVQSEEDILSALLGSGALARRSELVRFHLTMTEWLDFGGVCNIVYEFDGRKPVKTAFKDQDGFEFLPDYTGPTEFVFTKAVSKSAEEKKAEALANLLPLVPKDMFGHELAVGDMFIYARRDELVIARLVKTNEYGYITAETLIGKKEVRLQGDVSATATKSGANNPALMKFDKNEVLSTKLMVEKLKR